MTPVPKVDDVDLAFPARGGELTPAWDDIPDEYKNRSTKGARFFAEWFAGAVDWELVGLLPRENVDPNDAYRALRVIAGTYATKHEHKAAAMAFLLHEWFVDFRWSTTAGEHRRFEDEAFDREWLEAQGRS